MRILILTSRRRGIASRCLRVLCERKGIEVGKIILANGTTVGRKELCKRRLRKVRRIGIAGALNGMRIRGWYQDDEADDLYPLADELGVPVEETSHVNSDETRSAFKETKADIGLSLGNGFIASSVFSIPRHGMINLHGEVLPAFGGAQAIIWPIYERADQVGFTIHQITREIDRGDILYQRKRRMELHPSLRKTVEANLEINRREIPEALVWVCENYESAQRGARKQEGGRKYTTPSFWQFLRMLRNHKEMYRREIT